MCWHNCQSWSPYVSDPLYTDLYTRTLLSSQPKDDMSPSLRDFTKAHSGQNSTYGMNTMKVYVCASPDQRKHIAYYSY